MISARVCDSEVSLSCETLGVAAIVVRVVVVTACDVPFAMGWAGTGKRCWRRENP